MCDGKVIRIYWKRRRWLVAATSWCAVGLALAPTLWSQPATGRAASLPEFLRELSLDWLALEIRLQDLDRNPLAPARREAARLVWRDFESAISRGRWSEKQMARVLPSLRALAQQYPEMVTALSRAALAQGDFALLEERLVDFWRMPRDATQHYNLRVELERQSAVLDEFGRAIADTLRDQVWTAHDRHALSSSELQNALARQMFMVGWVTCYQDLLDAGPGNPFLPRAEQHFRRFLDLAQDAALSQLPIDWLALDTPWQTRALIGLAVVRKRAGHNADADWCWQVLARQTDRQGPDVERALWQFRACAWPGQVDDAARLASQVFDDSTAVANPKYWQTCIECGVHWQKVDPVGARELLAWGAAGLVRDGYWNALAVALNAYSPRENEEHWVDHWLRGLIAFQLAERATTRADYESAAAQSTCHLEEVVRVHPTEYASLPIASAWFLKAQMAWDAADWEAAADLAKRCRDLPADPAVDRLRLWSAWLTMTAHVHLAKQDRSLLPLAWESIAWLQQAFPASPEARRAELVRLKLENTRLSPSEALANLARISSTLGVELEVALERMQQMHRSWAAEWARHPEGAEPLRQLLLNEWQTWQQRGWSQGELAATARLLVVDVLLRGSQATDDDLREADRLLREHIAGEANLPPRSRLIEEGRYQQMTLAQRRQHEDQILSHAHWLADQARDPALERAALIVLAQHHESTWLRSQRQDQVAAHTLRDVLSRLVALGERSDSERMWRDPALRMAARRLAECEVALGHIDAADRLYDQLLATGTPDAELLTAAARIKMQLRQWAAAAHRWRELAAGVPAGSDVWLESRWQLVQCLRTDDVAAARTLRDQTLLLYPHMPDVWRVRLETVFDEQAPHVQ